MPCRPAAAPFLWEGREISKCLASTLLYLFPKLRRDTCISHSNHSHTLQHWPSCQHPSYCVLSLERSFYMNHFPFVRVPITDLVTLHLFNVLHQHCTTFSVALSSFILRPLYAFFFCIVSLSPVRLVIGTFLISTLSPPLMGMPLVFSVWGPAVGF